MSQATPFNFHQLVPGLDFMQNLMKGAMQAQKNAGHSSPLGNWIAPTLSVEDLDKRISELKTVLYWLEQNAHAVKATIQALEVQRLTLTTLSSMNVNLGEMAKAFSMPTGMAGAAAPAASRASSSAPTPAAGADASANPFSNWPLAGTPAPAPAPAAKPEAAPEPAAPPAEAETQEAKDGAAAMADPMNWWGTLTRQFQTLAGTALQGGEGGVPGMPGIGSMPGMGQAAQTAQNMVKAVNEQAAAMRKATAKTMEQVTKAPAKKAATKTAAKAPAKSAAKPATKAAPRKSASRGSKT